MGFVSFGSRLAPLVIEGNICEASNRSDAVLLAEDGGATAIVGSFNPLEGSAGSVELVTTLWLTRTDFITLQEP